MVSEDLCEDRPTQGGTGQWTRAERARWVCGRSARRESFDDRGKNLKIHQYIDIYSLVFTTPPPPKFLVACSTWLCYISSFS